MGELRNLRNAEFDTLIHRPGELDEVLPPSAAGQGRSVPHRAGDEDSAGLSGELPSGTAVESDDGMAWGGSSGMEPAAPVGQFSPGDEGDELMGTRASFDEAGTLPPRSRPPSTPQVSSASRSAPSLPEAAPPPATSPGSAPKKSPSGRTSGSAAASGTTRPGSPLLGEPPSTSQARRVSADRSSDGLRALGGAAPGRLVPGSASGKGRPQPGPSASQSHPGGLQSYRGGIQPIPPARPDGRPVPPPVGQSASMSAVWREHGMPTAERFNRYRILSEMGRGGMGCVMRAIDEELRRDVAVKEIAPEYLDSPEHVARFLREARITGRLDHPGIVPIYEIGRREVGGKVSLYYTMKLVKGRTLKQALIAFHDKFVGRDPDFRSEEGLRLLDALVAVCNAVAFAHSRSVIHRDLKPDNIMLGDYGETVLLDWGLAKVLSMDLDVGAGEDTYSDSDGSGSMTAVEDDPTRYGRTEMGAVMGTPQYLAPEQAAGRRDLLDKQTDVYSLGVVLYQVLTGALPFGDAKPLEVLRLVQEKSPEVPRNRRRGVPAELSAVCMKALSRDRNERYPTAGALAAELRRWIADQPVDALPEKWPTKVKRWMRTHRALAAGVVVALVLNVAQQVWLLGESWLRRAQQRSEARAVLDKGGEGKRAGWEDSPWASYRRGIARLKAAAADPMHLQDAADDFRRAALAENERENPLPMMALAVVQAKLGQPEEAAKSAEDATNRLKLVRARGLLRPAELRGEDVFEFASAESSLKEWVARWQSEE